MSLATIGASIASMGASAALNWQTLALKAAAILILAGGIFFGGYYVGTGQAFKATANQPAIAADAQHKQDVKQHGSAVLASGKADDQHKTSDAKAAPHIQYIHDLNTVFVTPPADPNVCEISADAIDHYNKAGH